MTENTLYFEIDENGDYIRVEIVNQLYLDSELEAEKNWLKSVVKYKLGSIEGEYVTNLQTLDFKIFKKELEIAFDELNRNAIFDGIESQVKIHLTGNGTGQFYVKCFLMDRAVNRNELQVEFKINQMRLPRIIDQLNAILYQYPSEP